VYLFILSAFNLILMYYLSSASAKLARFFYFGATAKDVSPSGLVYLVAPFGIWTVMSSANIMLILMFDVESLKKALQGATYAFGMTMHWDSDSGPNEDKEYQQGKNWVDACKAVGLKHVVFSGLEGVAHKSGGKLRVPHFDGKFRVEEYLRGSGLHHTIVRLAFYFENFLQWFSPKKTDNQIVLTLPIQENTKLKCISVRDLGPIVANILMAPDDFRGKTLGLSTQDLTLKEIADCYSKALGQTVVPNCLPIDEFKKWGTTNKMAGIDEMANMFKFLCDFEKQRANEYDTNLTTKLNPQFHTFPAWLDAHKNEIKIA